MVSYKGWTENEWKAAKEKQSLAPRKDNMKKLRMAQEFCTWLYHKFK